MDWRTRLAWLFRRDRLEDDLDEELRTHLDISTEENISNGMPPEEARYAARREFGNVTLVRESTRAVWVIGWLENLWRDVCYGVRTLARYPGFTGVALLSLSLCIGATTAIFSVFHAVWLRPLPHARADRLVAVSEVKLAEPDNAMGVALGNFADWREQCTAFENLSALHWALPRTVLGGQQAETAVVRRVSEGYFEMLGARPFSGRLFLPEDFEADAPDYAILSYGFWQRAFGSDPAILTRALRVPFRVTVIGIMSPDYPTLGGTHIDLWLAMKENWNPSRRLRYTTVIGLLRPGVDVGTAQSELDVVARHQAAQYPEQEGMGARIEPFRSYLYGEFGGRLAVFSGAVGLLLLIGCINVASLLLARVPFRQKEMAMRSALGASRPRLVRQLLVESALLSVAGAAFGLLFAVLGVKLLVGINPAMVPRAEAIEVNPTVLSFALLVALLSTLLFGLAPALGASKPNLQEGLKESSRPAAIRFGGPRVRSGLVVAEIALSLVLLNGAFLMVHSIWRVLNVDVGFDEEHLAAMTVSLPPSEYLTFFPNQGGYRTLPRAALARERIHDGLRALPGVVSVSAAAVPPVMGCYSRTVGVGNQSQPSDSRNSSTACLHPVSPDYFSTLRLPLLKGRGLGEGDNERSPAVAVISASLSARYFPGQNPIGKVLRLGRSDTAEDQEPPVQVVGVVADVRQNLLRPPSPAVYMPLSQLPSFVTGGHLGERADISFVMRTAVELESLIPAMRRVVGETDRDILMSRFDTMRSVRALYLRSSRFYTWLLAVFAGIAVVLTAIGVYGIVSYAGTRRTHEIGLRVALGATRSDVMRLIMKQGIVVTVLGLGIGLAAAWSLTRLLAAQLYEVRPTDAATFAVTAAVLSAVVLLASFLPAWRAAHLDPNQALRYE